MTDIRARLADALRDQWTPSTVVYGTDEPVGFYSPEDWAHHVADVLLSLPGIAIVEVLNLSSDRERILSTLDEIAGLRYYFGTEKGYAIAAALLAADTASDSPPDGSGIPA
jgi:hypothetical protein